MGQAQLQIKDGVYLMDNATNGLDKSPSRRLSQCGRWYRIETNGVAFVKVTKLGTDIVIEPENDPDLDSHSVTTPGLLLPSERSSHPYKLKNIRSEPETSRHAEASSAVTYPESDISETEVGLSAIENDEASDTMDLKSLGLQPTKQAVDSWVVNFRARCRQLGENLRCPACNGIQRRPSALKNHLYFRYRIEPYECSKGCGFTLSTMANMKRHAQKCNGIPPHREDWVPSCRPSPRNKQR